MHQFQVLLKHDHAIYGVVSVVLLNSDQVFRRRVQMKTCGARALLEVLVTVLCSTGAVTVLCTTGAVVLCHHLRLACVARGQLARGRPHACWAVHRRRERV